MESTKDRSAIVVGDPDRTPEGIAVALTSNPLPISDPETLGFCAHRLQRMISFLETTVAQQNLPGAAVLIARDGEIACRTVAGQQNVETGDPLQLDTIYRIASMTKPITCVGVMILYEEGRFRLEDPVSRYIPEFAEPCVFSAGNETIPAKGEITIQHLLTHTSGLAYGGDPRLRQCAEEAGLTGYPGTLSTGELIRGIARLPLAHDPGAAWTYGTSTDVLGHLIEVLWETRLDEFLKERIFAPLRMIDTGFLVPREQRHRLIPVYTRSDGRLIRKPAGPIHLGPLNLSIDDVCREPQHFHMGGGGLASTLHDFTRFVQMLLNGGELDGVRLLGRKTVDRMTTNSVGDLDVRFAELQGDKMGLGLAVREDRGRFGGLESVGTFAWSGGFTAHFWADPAQDLIGVVLSQYSSSNVAFLQTCRTLAYQALVD